MELEFYQELLLSAVFSLILAFVIGKIAIIGSGDGDQEGNASISSDLASAAASCEKSEGSVPEPTQDVGHLREGSGAEEVKENAREKMPEVLLESVRFRREETDHLLSIAERDGEGDEGSLLCGEDGWEGIERSELEKLFGLASVFVGGPRGAVALARLSSDLQMELYGLYKVATEGPCYSSQPLPLNFSARARWQAWQKLGNMAPDVAMERYVSLLSKNIPGWKDENSGDDVKHNEDIHFPEAGLSDSDGRATDLSLQSQLCSREEGKNLSSADAQIGSIKEGPKILEAGLANTFLLGLLSPTRGAFFITFW